MEWTEPLVVCDSRFSSSSARLEKDYEDYSPLLIDSRETELSSVRSKIAKELEKRPYRPMNKHKKGRWSQIRFNCRRKEAIKSFAEVCRNCKASTSRRSRDWSWHDR